MFTTRLAAAGVLVGGLLICHLNAADRLSVAGVRGYPGISVSVPLIYKADTNFPPQVVGIQAEIVFDAARVSSGAAIRSTTVGDFVVRSSQPTAGVRRVLIYSPSLQPLTNGTLAVLSFTVSAGTYREVLRLGLTNVMVVNTTPSAVDSTNVPGFIAIGPIFIDAEQNANFFLDVQADRTYTIEASTNLVNWVPLSTNFAAGPVLDYTDTNASQFSQRFYRAVSP